MSKQEPIETPTPNTEEKWEVGHSYLVSEKRISPYASQPRAWKPEEIHILEISKTSVYYQFSDKVRLWRTKPEFCEDYPTIIEDLGLRPPPILYGGLGLPLQGQVYLEDINIDRGQTFTDVPTKFRESETL